MKRIILLLLMVSSFVQMQSTSRSSWEIVSRLSDFSLCPICAEVPGLGHELRLHECSFEEVPFIECLHEQCFKVWQKKYGDKCDFCSKPLSFSPGALIGYVSYSTLRGHDAWVTLLEERGRRWRRDFKILGYLAWGAGLSD